MEKRLAGFSKQNYMRAIGEVTPRRRNRKRNCASSAAIRMKASQRAKPAMRLRKCVEKLPDVEAAYQNRPATKEQRAKLRSYGEKPDEDPDDPLTYEQAKELIQECEISEQQEYLDELEKEYIIDVEDWAELYPGLTW